MKSIEMTSNTFEGITADASALTLDDVKKWFETHDEAMIPAIIAVLKAHLS